MANKLKVDELRSELSKRGLSTAGIKAALVQRLELALEEEKKPLKAAADGLTGKKRKRELTADGSIAAVKDLRQMGIRQLREQAVLRGVSATGSKKELLERLCEDSEKGESECAKKCEGEEKSKDLQMEYSSSEKGAAEVDEYLPDDIKANYHVYKKDGEFYDAMLNQTNVGDNNNKFYVIQVLQSNDGGKFMAYSRWGRVGVKGQDKLQGPYTSEVNATREFLSKFFMKTRNHWAERKNFISYPKYYTWLEMDYTRDEKSEDEDKSISTIEDQMKSTKLDLRVAKFISLICNSSMMEQQMIGLGYNAKKLPLGKLSKSTILKGYDVLRRIADVIGQSDRKKLEQLSGVFYTIIPHDFGFRKMKYCIIDTFHKLKLKLEMVEALSEIEAARTLLNGDGISWKEDPLGFQYQCLRCNLTPLELDSAEFSMIKMYMQKTGANQTDSITQIFRASREGERERFDKFSQTKNRTLLWHGSSLTNWAGILSQGLRIAPPEAPVNGYAFGKGIYFADMFSKSEGYSRGSRDGVLVLCEVALGEMNELFSCDCHAEKLLNGKLSTKGVGQIEPDPSESHVLEDGVIVPLGTPKELPEQKGVCWENEFIVYNVDQVRIRYVVQVSFY